MWRVSVSFLDVVVARVISSIRCLDVKSVGKWPCLMRTGNTMLTTDEEIRLVGIIVEDFGNDLDKDELIDCFLMLCEDIAGLEFVNDAEIQSIGNRLWRIYDKH